MTQERRTKLNDFDRLIFGAWWVLFTIIMSLGAVVHIAG